MQQRHPWVITLVGGFFFFFFFVQIVAFNPLADSLFAQFKLSTEAFGTVNAAYFWAISLMALPAGVLTDRIASRTLMLSLVGIVTASLVVMAFTDQYSVLLALRFVQGLCHAFSFLVCLKLASQWISSKQLATASSLIMTLGLLGGGIAQPAFSYLDTHFGLRATFLMDAGLGAVIWALFWLMVHDNPQAPQQAERTSAEFKADLLACLKNPVNALGGIYVCLLNLPIILLGAAWGQLYLQTTFGVVAETSANIVFMLFLGFMFGSPLFGWVSDRLGSRQKPLLWGAVLTTLSFAALMWVSAASTPVLMILFFMVGFLSSCQVVAYPMVAENNPARLMGTGMSVATFTLMIGNALAQMLFGYLVAIRTLLNDAGEPLYTTASFQYGLGLMLIACIVGIGLAFSLKDR